MAHEVNNAADAETAYRQHRRCLSEKLQIGSVPPSKLRSIGIANESYELWFCKRFSFLFQI